MRRRYLANSAANSRTMISGDRRTAAILAYLESGEQLARQIKRRKIVRAVDEPMRCRFRSRVFVDERQLARRRRIAAAAAAAASGNRSKREQIERAVDFKIVRKLAVLKNGKYDKCLPLRKLSAA